VLPERVIGHGDGVRTETGRTAFDREILLCRDGGTSRRAHAQRQSLPVRNYDVASDGRRLLTGRRLSEPGWSECSRSR
jgi:hypothetical protein